MAQAEDTELRDLVIEALEKNGSLAKIRALLRANIFLAFEDECENKRQNINLDSVLKLPEGILCLSVIHEFLEFCNLKNTLFVYMSESRQGKEYNYDGKNLLAEKLNFNKQESKKEPVLVTLIRNILRPYKKYDQSDNGDFKKHENCGDNAYKDEQNSTYIVHEDSQSSTTSNSHSDTSSDEKNKLHLRLQLDNSDTDTSSDSTREKTSSEYMPNERAAIADCKNANNSQHPGDFSKANNQNNLISHIKQQKTNSSYFMPESKHAPSSSDSTSYLDLKPYNSLDEKLINTSGVPFTGIDNEFQIKVDSEKTPTASSVSPILLKTDGKKFNEKKSPHELKSDPETAEYSYDFSSSHVSRYIDDTDKQKRLSESVNEDFENNQSKKSQVESPRQDSQSSRSSVSISDVADLISEKSLSFSHQTNDEKSSNNKSNQSKSNPLRNKSDCNQSKILSDDSGDFTVSPVPSLSNLSLDIHSD